MIKTVNIVAKPSGRNSCGGCLLMGIGCSSMVGDHFEDPRVDFVFSLGLPDCVLGYIYVLEKKDEV